METTSILLPQVEHRVLPKHLQSRGVIKFYRLQKFPCSQVFTVSTYYPLSLFDSTCHELSATGFSLFSRYDTHETVQSYNFPTVFVT